MSALKPYTDWMLTHRKGAPNAVAGESATVDWRAFKQYRWKMGKRLERAKRFICPIDVKLVDNGQGLEFDAAPYLEQNPHLPFPYVYLQCELDSEKWARTHGGQNLIQRNVDGKPYDGAPLWIVFILAELDKHRFEGMYAAWVPETGAIWEQPYRLVYSPEGISATRFGVPSDDDEHAHDNSLEFLLFLPLWMIHEINSATSDALEQHPGRSIVLPTSKTKHEKIEHTRLIHIGKGSGGGGEATGEGAKHRELDVRGHWRHLKHGRVVWVRSHKRGDPALGTLDSEYLTGEQHA